MTDHTFCLICGSRTSLDSEHIVLGAKRRSRLDPSRCVPCAGTMRYSNRPGRYVEPRYCTCTGRTPPPLPWGECPACRRLVEAMSA